MSLTTINDSLEEVLFKLYRIVCVELVLIMSYCSNFYYLRGFYTVIFSFSLLLRIVLNYLYKPLYFYGKKKPL